MEPHQSQRECTASGLSNCLKTPRCSRFGADVSAVGSQPCTVNIVRTFFELASSKNAAAGWVELACRRAIDAEQPSRICNRQTSRTDRPPNPGAARERGEQYAAPAGFQAAKRGPCSGHRPAECVCAASALLSPQIPGRLVRRPCRTGLSSSCLVLLAAQRAGLRWARLPPGGKSR